jgi:hypothetical protein
MPLVRGRASAKAVPRTRYFMTVPPPFFNKREMEDIGSCGFFVFKE